VVVVRKAAASVAVVAVKKAAVARAVVARAVVVARKVAVPHRVAVAGLHREARGRRLELRVHQVCNGPRGLRGLLVASRIPVVARFMCLHPI